MVPASTSIKYKRVGNIDTDRLGRRHAWILANGATIARAADARIEIRMMAREFHAITTELRARGVRVAGSIR